MTQVGARYQAVIERGVRRRLGIRTGWVAVQTVVGDHLEVRFLPPEHERSLAGSLSQYAGGTEAGGEHADEERMAWEEHVDEEWR
jgi:bifunctional DNA-binding transcriptional regulator/antitoxin component of YhaV-PrlF toxin-antitoxin module